MKRLSCFFLLLPLVAFVALAAVIEVPEAPARMSLTLIGGSEQSEEPGSGITVTHLAGANVNTEVITIACNTLSPSGMVLVSSATAYGTDPGGGNPSTTVAGCGMTWTEVAEIVYGFRRWLTLSKGIGTWNTSGNLTITADDNDEGTIHGHYYSLDDVTGADTAGTPLDAAVTEAGTGANNDLPDVGSPDAGDVVFSLHGDEDYSDSIALTSGITQLYKTDGTDAEGVRSFVVGYDDSATVDETPGFTSSTSGAYGGIGVIINVAP